MEARAADIGLHKVRGPSALSGGWRRFIRLSWHLARTDFHLRYHGSVLGYLWSLLNPLLYFGVLYLAFTRVIRIGGRVEDYPAILLFNLMLFLYFAEATSRAVTSIVARENLVRKTEFPRLAVPVSMVFSALVTLAFNMIIVIGYILLIGTPVRATWLLLPVVIFGVALFAGGAAILLSALYVRYRDTNQIWTVCTRALVYMAPVILPFELYPESWRIPLSIDPLVPILVEARHWIIDPNAPTFAELTSPGVIAAPIALLVVLWATAIWYFNREAPNVAEDL
jgi:ABC-2 type transport system permease protein